MDHREFSFLKDINIEEYFGFISYKVNLDLGKWNRESFNNIINSSLNELKCNEEDWLKNATMIKINGDSKSYWEDHFTFIDDLDLDFKSKHSIREQYEELLARWEKQLIFIQERISFINSPQWTNLLSHQKNHFNDVLGNIDKNIKV